MEPIGFTFKKEGFDKYGKPRQGELMIIHQCQDCGQISINRIAADDEQATILKIFENSKELEKEILTKLKQEGIRLLSGQDEKEIRTQLFGKPNVL
jgi:isocitrate dehydrogenase kinase/phosphatase